MKDIYYCSSVQTQLFKFNTRSNFKNYIDIDNLDYLPEGTIGPGNLPTEPRARPTVGRSLGTHSASYRISNCTQPSMQNSIKLALFFTVP